MKLARFVKDGHGWRLYSRIGWLAFGVESNNAVKRFGPWKDAANGHYFWFGHVAAWVWNLKPARAYIEQLFKCIEQGDPLDKK